MEKHSNIVRARSFSVFKLLLLGVSLWPGAAIAQQGAKPTSTIDPMALNAAKEPLPPSISTCPQPRSKCFKTIDPSGTNRRSLPPPETRSAQSNEEIPNENPLPETQPAPDPSIPSPIEETDIEEIPVEDPPQEAQPDTPPSLDETPLDQTDTEEIPVEDPPQEAQPDTPPSLDETPLEEADTEEIPLKIRRKKPNPILLHL